MTDRKILENAPEGATHVDRANHYWKFLDKSGGFLMCDKVGGWVDGFSPIVTRSLADIKRIVDLERVGNEYRTLVADLRYIYLKEQERDKHNFAVVPRSLNRDMRIAYHESIERHEDCQEDLGCPDDQWTAMIEAWVVLKEQE